MRRVASAAVICLMLLSACTTARTRASEDSDREPTRLEIGRELYVKYCASCHGTDGKGNGPMAKDLSESPTNLTLIAEQHGGKFPYGLVMRSIGGRLSGTHDSQMPAWGRVFQADAAMDVNDRAAVEGRIMLLTGYLESIQQK